MVYNLSDIAKNYQVRKKYTIQLGENELVLKVSLPLSHLFIPFPFLISIFFSRKVKFLAEGK